MDSWPSFQIFTFNEFTFPVNRYVEYIDGNITSQKSITCNIIFKQHNNVFCNNGLITVDIHNNPIQNKILSHFEFDTCITMGDRLLFYIYATNTNINDTALQMIGGLMGFTRDTKNYIHNEPIIGNVFTVNHNVAKITFKFENRLIEFY